MSYPIKYPTPQGANIQIFYAADANATQSWIKPQGASFVWFTLIGAGGAGAGDNSTPGNSGGVTNCMVPAFLIPDQLNISVGVGSVANNGTNTTVYYSQKATNYTLLYANGGTQAGFVPSAAATSNYFSCMGFFQGVGSSSISGTVPSSNSFLSGGSETTANYGYTNNNGINLNGSGYFQMQPIIVSMSGFSDGASKTPSGIGSGGSYDANSGIAGGNGLVVIITW